LKSSRTARWAYTAAAFTYWLSQVYSVFRLRSEVPMVEQMPVDESRTGWPGVSVIIAACNEEAAIEEAVRSRLDDDYPGLELILVDDRSTDRTGEIADRLAGEDPRLKVIHITKLPEGWLGKVHAMNEGALAAIGDWLLFSDADVRVREGAIKRTVAYAEEFGLDHLPVLPELLPSSPLIDIGISTLSRILLTAGRVWAVGDPRSSAAAGSGSFNLVRRSALDATEGLEWLKLEVADDAAMGQMLKASGARQRLAYGRGQVMVNFYPTVRDALAGSERALFTALGGFSMLRTCAIGVGLTALDLSPLLLAVKGRNDGTRRIGRALFAIQIGVSAAFNRWFGRPAFHAVFAPLASTALAALMVRAGVLGKVRGGIMWRGTFYPTSVLKPGRRFKP